MQTISSAPPPLKEIRRGDELSGIVTDTSSLGISTRTPTGGGVSPNEVASLLRGVDRLNYNRYWISPG